MTTVLIVEDQKLQQQLIQFLLSNDQTVVETVESGDDVLQAVREYHPDLVLMDIDLRGMNGVAATQHIKSAFPQTPVIVSSGYVNIEMRFKMFTAGAAAYLIKPYSETDLLAAIDAVVAD